MNKKEIVLGTLVIGLVSIGAYLFAPPPEEAAARERKWSIASYKIATDAKHNFFEFRLKSDPNILCVYGETGGGGLFCIKSPKR